MPPASASRTPHSGEPVTADTTFPICSITKTFTATLAMQLSEQGDLDLNDRIVDILPWFRVKDREATSRARVIDLFHHHTGWSGDHCFDPVPPGGSITEKCMLQAHYLEQVLPFDQTWMYNNTNLAFAGHVLSVVGGKPYETLVEERILSPLGMDASCFNYSTAPPDDHFAWGHPPIYDDDKIGELQPIFTPFPPTAGSAGGIQSTVHDMLKYARFQLDGNDSSGNTLLSKEALDFAHAPAVDAPTGEFTGLTWFVRNVRRGHQPSPRRDLHRLPHLAAADPGSRLRRPHLHQQRPRCRGLPCDCRRNGQRLHESRTPTRDRKRR